MKLFKIFIGFLVFVTLSFNIAMAGPIIDVSEPLTVNRSDIVSGSFFPYTQYNVYIPWSFYGDYKGWQDSGIIAMLSKIKINNINITPQEGDSYCYTRLYNAMGGGTVSFIQKFNKVAVLSNKVRKFNTNLPLNVNSQIVNEGDYTAPYTFKRDYSIDYSNHTPLFTNDFVVIDDFRQIKFELIDIDSNATSSHAQFTDPIIKITINSYQDTEVPNNVVGLPINSSLKSLGKAIPNYSVDTGYFIKEIKDSKSNIVSLAEISDKIITDNENFKIYIDKEAPVTSDPPAVTDSPQPTKIPEPTPTPAPTKTVSPTVIPVPTVVPTISAPKTGDSSSMIFYIIIILIAIASAFIVKRRFKK